MDFGSAIFDNEEQARRDERRAYGLNSESESDMYSQDEDNEEDHVYIFDDDVPSERICASHARRDYGGKGLSSTVASLCILLSCSKPEQKQASRGHVWVVGRCVFVP